MIPVVYLTFIVGLALIVLAIIGGGLEIKEIKVPTLPIIPRALSFVLGGTLIVVSMFYPNFLPDGTGSPSPPVVPASPIKATPPSPSPPPSTVRVSPAPTPPPVPKLSQPILLAFSEEQRDLAHRLESSLRSKGFEVKSTLDDFSGIKVESREKPGTIRIVYKSAIKGTESGIVDLIRSQSPTSRLVESPNDNASYDLQIQLW
jgi:hypothetical protein